MALIFWLKYFLAIWALVLFHQTAALNISRPGHNIIAQGVKEWSDESQGNDTLDLFRRNTNASMADFDGLDDFCDDDPFFMSMTQENLDEAKPGKFYRDFLKSVKDKYPERYKSQTGPNLLGQFGWHDPNFHCSMHFPGCVLVPSCQDIVRGIRKVRILGHENVGDRMRDVARQEFFAARKIDEMARFFSQVERLLDSTVIHIGLRMDDIVNDFLPSTSNDQEAQFICILTQEVVDLAYNLVFVYVLNDLPLIDRQILAALTKTLKKNGEIWYDLKLDEMTRTRKEAGQNGTKSRWFSVSQDYTKDRCSIFFQDYATDKSGRATKMKDHISREFLNLTRVLDDTWDLLVTPGSLATDSENTTDIQSIDMGTWIDEGPWAGTWNEMLKKMSTVLDNMVTAFEEYSISTIWRSDRCSVKCRTNKKDAQKLCCLNKDDPKHSQSRYCPDERTVCQVQCHTVKDSNNEEKLLFGWDKLRKHSLTPELVVQKSWERRATMGPPNERMALDLVEEMPHYQHSMIALPICTSPYTQISSFAIDNVPMIKLGSRDRDQAMACYCGNWRGNETKAYSESLGLQPQSTDWLNGRAKEQMEVICPHNLRKLPPANHFLAFCELGIRFPHPGEPAKVRMQTNHLCDVVKDRTASMTEEEGNKYFCNQMPERKQIFNHELPWVDAYPPLPNHKIMCDRFNHAVKKHGYKMEEFSHVEWNH